MLKEENENIIQSLERMMANIGGLWFEIMLIKLFAKRVYTCPKCNHEIEKNIDSCPNCGVLFEWKI